MPPVIEQRVSAPSTPVEDRYRRRPNGRQAHLGHAALESVL
jgi:hypothetical protein